MDMFGYSHWIWHPLYERDRIFDCFILVAITSTYWIQSFRKVFIVGHSKFWPTQIIDSINPELTLQQKQKVSISINHFLTESKSG